MAAANPANAFARYGIAMEYLKAGRLEDAVAAFRAVLEIDPGYSAAYYHGGQTLEKLGRPEEARQMYLRGLSVTRDPHAAGELQAAMDILGDA